MTSKIILETLRSSFEKKHVIYAEQEKGLIAVGVEGITHLQGDAVQDFLVKELERNGVFIPDSERLALYSHLCQDQNERVRFQAVGALGLVQPASKETVELLQGISKQDASEVIQTQALVSLWKLGKVEQKEAKTKLLETIQSAPAEWRFKLIYELAFLEMETNGAWKAALESLQNEYPFDNVEELYFKNLEIELQLNK